MGDSEDEGESQSAAAEGGADLFPTAPLQPEPEPPPPPPGPPISYEPSCAHCMEPEFRIFWGCVWCFGTGFGMAEAGRKSLEERMRLKQKALKKNGNTSSGNTSMIGGDDDEDEEDADVALPASTGTFSQSFVRNPQNVAETPFEICRIDVDSPYIFGNI
eukprot:COSAG05_NODE_2489_length_2996_cov_3.985847_3_plen_160_part_00